MSVFQQIAQKEHTEKVNLLLSCGQYKLWPRQPLLQVAQLIEWMSYPPNTGNTQTQVCSTFSDTVVACIGAYVYKHNTFLYAVTSFLFFINIARFVSLI